MALDEVVPSAVPSIEWLLARSMEGTQPDAGVFVLGPDLAVVAAAGGGLRRLDVDPVDALGATLGELLPAELCLRMLAAASAALRGVSAETYGAVPDGTEFRIRAGPTFGGNGEPIGCAIAVEEVPQADSDDGFRALFEQSPVATLVITAEGIVVHVNHSMQEFLGHPLVPGQRFRFSEVVHADDIAAAAAQRDRLLAGQADRIRFELRFVRPDGQLRWAAISGIRLELSRWGTCVLGHVEDVTARRAAEDALRHAALHDQLCGLPNRALLLDRVERALARARRGGPHLALLFCDLNGFKRINDTLGHDAGDEVIRSVASRIAADVRHRDTPARIGGDEFAVLCEDPGSESDITAVVRRLRDRIGRPIRVADHNVSVSASIGVAVSDGSETAADLLRRADRAMYAAKRSGGAAIPSPRRAESTSDG